MDEHAYVFSAIRGVQAGREYYAIMCPFRLIPKIFLFDEAEVSPELRSQRVLNKTRVPEIARYILDNTKEYCFSAITASLDGEVKFTPHSEAESGRHIGTLSVGMSAVFIINDGQHRRAAIEEALKTNPQLGTEKICVVLFADRGLKRSQQMFSDLNKYAVRPSNSIGILYDHRDPLAELTRDVIQGVPLFRDRIELQKTSISNRSRKIFTLSSLYGANRALLGMNHKLKPISLQQKELCVNFWTKLAENMSDWTEVQQGRLLVAEFRRDYVNGHGVILHSLGHVGHSLIAKHPKNWSDKLTSIRKIDWSRRNAMLWEGTAMIGGRMSASPANIILSSAIIKKQIGLELSPEEISHCKALKVKVS